MTSFLRIVPTIASRLVLLGFAVIGSLSIPESRKLLNENYERDGDTLLIPLKVCQPSGVAFDGQTITMDAETGDQCRSLDYLVNACTMSLLFGIVAIGIFVICDFVSRRGAGNKAFVGGMGLFLVFILLQTAVMIWAIHNESIFWIKLFDSVLDDHFKDYGINDVDTHGDSWMFMVTGGAAVLGAALLVVEFVASLCCRRAVHNPTASEHAVDTENVNKQTELPIVAPTSVTEGSGSGELKTTSNGTPADEQKIASNQPSWASGWANPF